ncbi:MAG TPA: hypothetical protein VJB35_05715 [Candidatus Nanoarchaeia archaeon]|nr:hypothetical protein [Candidatus Nanoarchaeia archaeon]
MLTKRGQGLSVNAIILMILGVIVLAVLAIGFTTGWKTFTPWIKQNNVDQIAQACQIACSTGAKYEFCTASRVLQIEKTIEGTTDEQLKDENGNLLFEKDKVPQVPIYKNISFESGKSYTCKDLSFAPVLGVDKCPAITCDILPAK